MAADQKRNDSAESDGTRLVTVSLDALKAMNEEAAKNAVAAVLAGQLDADAQFERAVNEFRGKNHKATITVEYHDCESPITGATFRARCLVSRSFPMGRLVDLEDYQFPAHVGEWRAPDDKNPEANAVSRERWEHSRYMDYYCKDLNTFAGGRPFTKALLKSEAERRRAMDAAK